MRKQIREGKCYFEPADFEALLALMIFLCLAHFWRLFGVAE